MITGESGGWRERIDWNVCGQLALNWSLGSLEKNKGIDTNMHYIAISGRGKGSAGIWNMAHQGVHYIADCSHGQACQTLKYLFQLLF